MVWKPKTKTIIRKDNWVKLKYKLDKNGKVMTWRPTKKTEDVLQKLKYAFMRNCTEAEACAYAEIWESTLNKRKEDDPKFIEQIRAWKAMYAQSIKFKSYERAMNAKNKDSTDILFKIDDSYKERKEIDVWETSLVAIAKAMQQKRLENEKWDKN